jgi:predicted lipoprotein with Yx(FWY)xxD motif
MFSMKGEGMRGRIRWILPVALIAAIGAGAAMAATSAVHSSATSVKLVDNVKFGKMLVGPTGRTLYRYTVDRKGVNRCTKNATCAKYWPELLVKAGTKPAGGAGVSASLLGTIKAAHGMAQVTYAGFPLYYFAGDTKAGATSGQGLDAKWYVVNAKGALVKAALSSSGSGSASGSTPPPTGTTSGGGSSNWG